MAGDTAEPSRRDRSGLAPGTGLSRGRAPPRLGSLCGASWALALARLRVSVLRSNHTLGRGEG